MRIREFNFALAIAASVMAHMLLWPASKRIHVQSGAGDADSASHVTEVTLQLNAPAAEVVPKPQPPKPPKAPLPDSPDEMGEKKGKGTGAQGSKGEQPLKAPEADQDQPYTNRVRPGNGRTNQIPIAEGPRGENGSGGQRGGPQVAMNSPAPTPQQQQSPATAQPSPPAHNPPKETRAPDKELSVLPPQQSPLHTPPPPTPAPTPVPPVKAAPPPSKTASVGAGQVDLKKPPADEVKAKAPVVQIASAADGSLPIAPDKGPTVAPTPAVGTAPPTPKAQTEHRSVVTATPLPLPVAPVIAPPPPAAEPSPIKPAKKPDVAVPQTPAAQPAKKPDVAVPQTPAAQPAKEASALVSTGDSMAPGHDRPAAAAAQQSDSESDPFSKKSISAVLHDGRLEVRPGRKVKTTRPHILAGGYADLFENPNAYLVLKISIDETGKVRAAHVIRSSGSVAVDQPCLVAVYDWWFEPMHDKQGRPINDAVEFTIQFR